MSLTNIPTVGDRVNPKYLFGGVRTHVDVYLNYKCNLSCTHCFVGDDLKLSYTFDFAELVLLLETCYAAGAVSVSFLGGEPTLYVKLAEAIEIAYAIGYKEVKVITNGMKPSQKVMTKLNGLKKKPIMVFSIDGYSESIFERIRGKNTFKILKESIKNAIKNNFSCGAITTVSNVNIHEILLLIEYLDSLNFKYINIHYMNPIGSADQDYCILPNIWLSFWDEMKNVASKLSIKVNFEKKFHLLSESNKNDRVRCVVKGDSDGNVMVFPDGRVYLCALFFNSQKRNSYFWHEGNFILNDNPDNEKNICNKHTCNSCPASEHIKKLIPNSSQYNISCMYNKTIT